MTLNSNYNNFSNQSQSIKSYFANLKFEDHSIKIAEPIQGHQFQVLREEFPAKSTSSIKINQQLKKNLHVKKVTIENEVIGKKIYVGNLHRSTTNKDLIELFSPFGKIKLAYISNRKDTNPYKFGFVTFLNRLSALKALKKYKISFRNRKVIIRSFKPLNKKSSETKNNKTLDQKTKGTNKKVISQCLNTRKSNPSQNFEKFDQQKLLVKSSAQKAILKYILNKTNSNHSSNNIRINYNSSIKGKKYW